MPFCTKCGTEVQENVEFCPKCGYNQQSEQTSTATPVADTEVENLSFFGYFVKCLKNCLKNYAIFFKGRANRKEYWVFRLVSIFVIIKLIEIIILIDGETSSLTSSLVYVLDFALLFGLAILIFSIAITALRLHKIGKSVSWMLGFFATIYVIVLLIGYWASFRNIEQESCIEEGQEVIKVWLFNYCPPARKALEKNREKSSINYGVFIDWRDGKEYKTIKIGTQVWMAENLNYRTPDGTSRCYPTSGNTSLTDRDNTNCDIYGRLYNWNTAMNGATSSTAVPNGVRGVCPAGWHLPSESEYEELNKAVGREKVAGKKLKTTSGWNNNGNGTDEFGFSALPGGYGYSAGYFGNVGDSGSWWWSLMLRRSPPLAEGKHRM